MHRQILHLAIPNIISTIAIPLLGLADTALMGHQDSEIYLGAIAIGGVLFNFIYWGFGFLRMGTTGLTAQSYGQQDLQEMILHFARALGIALVIGLLLIALQNVISYIGFFFIPASSAVTELGKEYFHIRIYAAPAALAQFALMGWFLGMQNAIFPMIMSVVVTGLNIALNLIFVLLLGMDSNGVALGTVLAQYVGMLLGLVLFFSRYGKLLPLLQWKEIMDVKALKRFFSVNGDIFLRTLLLIFTFSFFTARSAKMGDTVLAANQVLLQFLGLISYGIDGFAYAAESLVGRYFGAKYKDKLVQAVKYSFYWGMGIAAGFSVLYSIWGNEFLSLFTDQEDILQAAAPYLVWIAIAPLVNGFCYIWDGIYIGATASKAMRNSMIIATLVVFLPAYFILVPMIGNHGLWLALTLFMAARGLLLTLMARKSIFIFG